jgi:hypothetical protein
VDIATPNPPSALGLTDLNGDAKLDLVVAVMQSNAVSVRLGNGDGTFASAVDVPVGTGPNAVELADFNGDGDADLVTANLSSKDLTVLLGKGDGTFEAKVSYAVQGNALVVGDFNDDNHLDIASANYGTNGSGNSVSVLFGVGNGTFSQKADFAVGAGPIDIIAADFNNDGKLDLATANQGTGLGNTVSVLLAKGLGDFLNAGSYVVGTDARAIASRDINNDKKGDLVVANRIDGTVSVLLGKGDGSFGTKTDFAVGLVPLAVAVGDLNNDGKLDIVSANDSKSLSILRNGACLP